MNPPIQKLSKQQIKKLEELTGEPRPKRKSIDLHQALGAIEEYIKEQKSMPGITNIVGVHLEGPYISRNCKGAHDETVIQDTIDYNSVMEIITAHPGISQWKFTIGPDLVGALQFMQDLKLHKEELDARGISILINAGHSNPSPEKMRAFMNYPQAVGVTHCGNACGESAQRPRTDKSPLSDIHIKSNLVNWVVKESAYNQQTYPGIELIVDGRHLTQEFVEYITKNIDAKTINLVTDALGPAGLSDGRYMLGTLHIYKKGEAFYLADPSKPGEAYTTNPPTLAGGAAPLHACAHRFSEWAFFKEKSVTAKLNAMFHSAIENPRKSSLSSSAIQKLPDINNFIIVAPDCKLVLSMCNGAASYAAEEQVIKYLDKLERSPDLPLARIK